jgi:glycosyltransferase involved in cell wall biosynthesis
MCRYNRAMPRLAWFSPVPPSRSGIAAYSEEILPMLAAKYQIDVFTAPLEPGHPRPDGHPPVFEAHDFVWKHFTSPYDLVVYQLGNAMCHRFMWPHMFRHPGLVVLHDPQLHHSRAGELLAHGRGDDYHAEFRANHPSAPEDAAEMVVRDFADAAYYFWPMRKLVVDSARLVAVHTERLAWNLGREHGVEVSWIRMGVGDPDPEQGRAVQDGGVAGREARQALRARYGIPSDAVVFSAVGLVTPEKRLSTLLQVMPAVLHAAPNTRLLLVGGVASHYDALAEAASLGLADRVAVTGYVPNAELGWHLKASDVAVCLRWPSGGETSASWLRALAAGLPTIVTDLPHTDEMAFLDPRSWTVQRAASGPGVADTEPTAVCVGIDVVDEAHSLEIAMSRLALDPGLRRKLGQAARTHWRTFHTLGCMKDDYERVLTRALARPAVPPRNLPTHLDADGTSVARRILDRMGMDVDFLRRDPPA